MKILAIETSCDETSVAVVENGATVLSCETATSLALHAETGGIIPENAARKQVEYIIPTLEAALTKAFPTTDVQNRTEMFAQIDAIAVTVGPGLIGSLLVGVESAKTLAALFKKPIIPVNHVKAHIYAAFLSKPTPQFPCVALVVSGGHTDFVYMRGHDQFEWIGGTRDDAAGEAFDKCARLLGLGYPGGPAISKHANSFIELNPETPLTLFPRPMAYDDTFDLSFSGLKTAVARMVVANEKTQQYNVNQLAAEVQQAIVDSLIIKSKKILVHRKPKSFIVCGGVSANVRLREGVLALQINEVPGLTVHVPQAKYSTDNAAMIGSYAYFYPKDASIEYVDASPELHF